LAIGDCIERFVIGDWLQIGGEVRATRPVHRIVLAYSGNPTTTVAISWLAEQYGAEVVTVTLDLDQRTGLEATRDRALAAGAVRAHVVDACDEFARDFIVPALRAGAVTPDGDLVMAALTRPVIAKHLVAIAQLEGAAAVAHGSAGERVHCFESLVRDLDPSLIVLAPVCEWTLTPAELVTYARARRLSIGPIDASSATRSVLSAPDYPATVDVVTNLKGSRELVHLKIGTVFPMQEGKTYLLTNTYLNLAVTAFLQAKPFLSLK
jgi:hypothetical protein